MRKFFTEFCDNSSIHGVRYFTERRRHWSERLWWLIAISLSVYLLIWSILNMWVKWGEYPVTVRFREKDLLISTIPFPTVTICPQTKFLRNKLNFFGALESLIDTPDKISDIESSRLGAVLNFCPSPHIFAPKLKNKFVNASIYEIIKDIAPSFERTLYRCMWQGKIRGCSSMFTKVFTQNGYCFVFNALNSHEMYTQEMSPDMMTENFNQNVSNWSLDSGYNNDFSKWNYPIRVYNAKKNGALYVVLHMTKEDIEYLCTGIIQGFRVTLTFPGEVSRTTGSFYEALLSERTEIALKPKLIYARKELLHYTPNQRQCFFNLERKLRFFRMYSRMNCEAECLSNFTKIECDCVNFSMPRDNATKICGTASISCYKAAEQALFGEDIIDGLKDVHAKQFREKCNCLPSCTTVTYDDSEIDRTKFDWTNMQQSWQFPVKDFDSIQPAVLSIHFAYPHVVTLQRIESYSLTDFLAICGGLLGLFLGVSMLSIIEFVYYSTLRLFWTVRQTKTKNNVAPFKRKTIDNIEMGYASRSKQAHKVPTGRARFRSGFNQLILAEITPTPFQVEQARVGFRAENFQKVK